MKTENMYNKPIMKNGYKKLPLILFASLCIMYLIMFLNVDQGSDIFFSLTRLYMSVLMVSSMSILMVLTMRGMYDNRRSNYLIVFGSLLAFIVSLVFLRNQTPIADVQYMKAMIPHHSSAIMTSKHAHLKDPEVKALADKIMQSQREEINQMEDLLRKLDR